MTAYLIEINTDNAAFADEPGYEIARILREHADRLESRGPGDLGTVTLLDINGNRVGTARLSGRG
jgi:hypothetical protein